MLRKKPVRYCYGFQKQNGAVIQIRGKEAQNDSSGIVLKYTISVEKQQASLWFRFPVGSAESISDEVADGVLVMLLPFALRGGYNIESALPISERLWFQLTQQLIPQFCAASSETWPVEIKAPLIMPSYHPDQVATAMSCGVDSFTTFFQYTRDMPEEPWKINLLTFFENGAHHNGTIGHSNREGSIYQAQLEHVQRFCESIHYPLLSVSSNLDEFLCEVFWKDSYHQTHTFRNAGFVLLLQKRIRAYYYAGARDISCFSVSLWDDTELYEKWLLPNLSTDCTHFFSVTTSMNRIEKTRYISQFPETYDNLLVCYAGGKNCGKCTKCVRLLLTLDYLGLLGQYKNSVPLELYQSDKLWYEAQMLNNRRNDFCLEEVYQTALAQGVHFPMKIRMNAFLSKVFSRAKTLRRILRNKISQLFHQ